MRADGKNVNFLSFSVAARDPQSFQVCERVLQLNWGAVICKMSSWEFLHLPTLVPVAVVVNLIGYVIWSGHTSY